MVKGVISFDSRTHLVDISGTVTAQLYDDDILQPVTLPFLLRHPGLTFRHDNAWLYKGHVLLSIVFKFALYLLSQPGRLISLP